MGVCMATYIDEERSHDKIRVCAQEEPCIFGDQTATKYLEILTQKLDKKAQGSPMVQKVLRITRKRQLKQATEISHEDNIY